MKKEAAAPAAKSAAGYLRLSVLSYPARCSSPEMKAEYLAEQREIRRHELRQIGAGSGHVIDFWYEDMGVSGRGKFLASRTGFEALTLAARTGLISDIYARDLARLFRNLVQQELWLMEMTALGVSVHIQDLPYAADSATRTLLRQQLGMIHEYQAARVGAVFAAVLHQHVAEGHWVGRSRSVWGLRYDPASKGYVLDETTAPYARRMFEVFNANGGSAAQTMHQLNRELRDGHPSSLAPPKARRWDTGRVLIQIRSPLYRRQAPYIGDLYDAPHLIPEVIAPDLLAATDALLAARQPLYDVCARRHEAPPEPYLYARRLRCAECGGNLQAYPVQGVHGPPAGLRVHWICQDALSGGECAARFRLPQYRLNALLDRALRHLFCTAQQQCEASGEPEWDEEAKQKVRRERNRLQIRRAGARHARLHALESYAQGLLTDVPALRQRLAVLEARLIQIEAELQALRPMGTAASPGDCWTWSKLGRRQKQFEAVWARDWWLPRDSGKAQLLADLDLRVSVRIHPRAPVRPKPAKTPGHGKETPGHGKETPGRGEETPPSRGKGPYKPRASAGVCEIVVFSPAFHDPRYGVRLLEPWESGQEDFAAGQEDFAGEASVLKSLGEAVITKDGPASDCSQPFERKATLDSAATLDQEATGVGRPEAHFRPLRIRETDEEWQRYQVQVRPVNQVPPPIDP